MPDIPDITSLGDDALVHQYEVTIHGIPTGGDNAAVTLRMDQNVDIPEQTIGEYEIRHKGHLFVKLNRMEETDKHITIDIRIDQDWEVYDTLRKWHRSSFNPQTGIATADSANRTRMDVASLYPDNSAAKYFTLVGLKIKGVKISAFDQNTGDPVRATVNFVYDYIEDNID